MGLKNRLHALALAVFRRLPVQGRRFVVRRLTPAYTVGAICVIQREDDHILFVKLSYRGRWGLPGGLLKRGESAEDAARREAREETGLEIETLGAPTVVVAEDPRRVDVVFRCRPVLGTSQDISTESAEIVEHRWFPPTDLPELHEEAATALTTLGRSHAAVARFLGGEVPGGHRV